MKKFTLSVFISFALLTGINAQTYCSVTTAIAYATTMPGITGFTLNTINRPSAGLECSTPSCNSYVATGLTTTLVAGATYTVRMNHNQDVSIAPNMNLRVWIDYNKNGTLNDAGETVMTTDNHAPAVYSTAFTVPLSATLGSTRMRATAKMPAAAGHTLPTPCDSPADPLGYHGEIEDYTVVIVSAAGINEAPSSVISGLTVFPNPTNTILNISFSVKENNDVNINLFDVTGKLIGNLMNNHSLKADDYNFKYDLNSIAPDNGIYFVKITSGNTSTYQKVIKMN